MHVFFAARPQGRRQMLDYEGFGILYFVDGYYFRRVGRGTIRIFSHTGVTLSASLS